MSCLYCSSTFNPKDYRQKFCNRSCAAKFNNLSRGNKLRAGRPDCHVCNKKLSKHQEKFCSHSCFTKFERKRRIEAWNAGNTAIASYRDGSLARWAKEYLLEECSYTCSCGWNKPNPILGRPILCIDHIDGNWTNNARENLQVLCYNCHTLTPTFGALNIGSQSGRRPGEGKRRNMTLLDTDDSTVLE